LNYIVGARNIANKIINILGNEDEKFINWARKITEYANKENSPYKLIQ